MAAAQNLGRIPDHSKYVHWDQTHTVDVASWIPVHFPQLPNDIDEQIYTWLDLHATHAWSVTSDTIHFANMDDATEFSLSWQLN
jgi:hypothetical protein